MTEGLPEGQNSVAKGKMAKGIEGKKLSESMRSNGNMVGFGQDSSHV